MKSSPPIEFGADSTPRYVGLWILVSVISALIVLTQVLGESQDWENYVRMFDAIRVDGLQTEGVERIEIGFKWLSSVLIFLSLTNTEVYAVIAAISLILKCVAVNGVSGSRAAFVFGMVFYLVCVAPLHELTQLRAAMSISFLFLSYWQIVRGGFVSAVLFAAAAAFFHLSALLVFFPLILVFFLRKGFFDATRTKIILLGLAFFFLTASAVAVAIFYLEDLLLVVSAYQQLGFGDEAVNPLSPSVLINIFFFVVGIFLWDDMTSNMRGVLVFQTIGIAVFLQRWIFKSWRSVSLNCSRRLWSFLLSMVS